MGMGQNSAPLISANMAVRASVCRAIPFDEELGPGQLGMADDVFFKYQMQAFGYRIAAAENAVVVHHFDPNRLRRPALLELARKNGRSHAYIWRHWHHSEIGWLHLRLAEAWLRRLVAHATSLGNDGLSDKEYDAAYRIEFVRRLRFERRRLARYPPPETRAAVLGPIQLTNAQGAVSSEQDPRKTTGLAPIEPGDVQETPLVRILLLTPELLVPGGHRIQAKRTGAALKNAGVDIEVALPGSHDPALFDVVHAFNAPREALREIRGTGVPVFVSPIWWSAAYINGETMPRPLRRRLEF